MEKFGSLVQNYSRGARLAVIMFDLNKRETFERIGTWIDMLHQNEQDNPIIYDMKHVIIGNKSDLKRFVSLQDASEKAKQYNAEYFEVSSLTGDGILLPLAYIEFQLTHKMQSIGLMKCFLFLSKDNWFHNLMFNYYKKDGKNK